ncbi:MAG: hypothetical protein JSV56_07390, partial [Methanomassiliicoccales archaeon]
MKKTLFAILTASLMLLTLLTIQWDTNCARAENAEGYESQITNDTRLQGKPAIYGDIVVWNEETRESGVSNWEIFVYDLSMDSDGDDVPNYLENETTGGRHVPDPAKIRITNNASKQLEPDIYGDIIVWEDERHGNFDIYMYDLAEDSDDDGLPNYIDDDDDGDGILDEVDGDSDPAKRRVTDNPAHQENPAIYGTKIVWVDKRYGNKDIFIYDMVSQKEAIIAGINEVGYQPDPGNPNKVIYPIQDYPDIYGDKIVWEDDRTFNDEIFLYNLSVDTDRDGVPNYLDDDRPHPDPAEEQITTNTGPDLKPSIYGNTITYVRPNNIFLYDIINKTERQLTRSNQSQKIEGSQSSIHGTKVVWTYDEGTKDIFIYDLIVDTDSDGVPNFIDDDDDGDNTIDENDPDKDPAVIRITNESEDFPMLPAIYTNKIVWQDSRNKSKPTVTDIYMFTLSENPPPKITYFLPSYIPEIEEGGSFRFNVSASDPMGGVITYNWFLDEEILPEEDTDFFEYFPDYSSAGLHEIKVVVSDGEHSVEKIWLIYVIDSGLDPLIITNIEPVINPAIIEGEDITLKIVARSLGSETLNVQWYESLIPEPSVHTEDIVDNEIKSELTFSSQLDYQGSNYIERFNITVEISDGKEEVSYTWVLFVHYLDDADMDGYSDAIEVAWSSDPESGLSTPL